MARVFSTISEVTAILGVVIIGRNVGHRMTPCIQGIEKQERPIDIVHVAPAPVMPALPVPSPKDCRQPR